MLSTEFNEEIGALVRSLSRHVTQDPSFATEPERTVHWIRDNVLAEIEEAILELIALHIKVRRLKADVDSALDSVGGDVRGR